MTFVREGLTLFSDCRGGFLGIAVLLDDAASVAKLDGDHQRAYRLAGAGAALQATSGAELAAIVNAEEGREWREAEPSDEENRAWAEGQAMTVAQAVAYALTADPAVSERVT